MIPSIPLTPAWWLVRIPDVFADLADAIAPHARRLPSEGDYHRIESSGAGFPVADAARIFLRWRLPVHHAWPCNPEKTSRFVEKAATAMAEKFSPFHPRGLRIGAFEPMAARGEFRKLASNLRGRTLQLMQESTASAESIAPDAPVVFALVGKSGLFCGLQTPREANGFHPGGTRYIRQSDLEIPSRAGAKIVEALHHIRLLANPPQPGTEWLELGASPGGMTAELIRHGFRVTAIDRAPLHPSLALRPELSFARADVTRWLPPAGKTFGALLCDMNGPAESAIAQVARLSAALEPGATVIHTLKTPAENTFLEIIALHQRILTAAAKAGLAHLQTTHLTYNRREFTMFLARPGR